MRQDVTPVPQKFIAEIDRGRKTLLLFVWGSSCTASSKCHLQKVNQTYSKTLLAVILMPGIIISDWCQSQRVVPGLCPLGYLPKLFRHNGHSHHHHKGRCKSSRPELTPTACLQFVGVSSGLDEHILSQCKQQNSE